MIKCPRCNGSGNEPEASSKYSICENCNGSGEIQLIDPDFPKEVNKPDIHYIKAELILAVDFHNNRIYDLKQFQFAIHNLNEMLKDIKDE